MYNIIFHQMWQMVSDGYSSFTLTILKRRNKKKIVLIPYKSLQPEVERRVYRNIPANLRPMYIR